MCINLRQALLPDDDLVQWPELLRDRQTQRARQFAITLARGENVSVCSDQATKTITCSFFSLSSTT